MSPFIISVGEVMGVAVHIPSDFLPNYDIERNGTEYIRYKGPRVHTGF